MSVRRLSFLFFAGALASGCTSLVSQGEQSPLNTQEVTVAAGDEGLKKAVETGENRDAARDEPLDEAIAPELKDAARDAREKLDNPVQKTAEAEAVE
ncbi:MAG TPA: lytic transglycosylase, partial [Marinobacter adhaerens]|nr:lytic transglycosylase [Marinobacter adhaerens]